MGTPDTIHVVGDDDRFVCATGHRVTRFTTHDLDDAMIDFYIVGERLLEAAREEVVEQVFWQDGQLVLRTDRTTMPAAKTAIASISSHCDACLPVFVDTDSDWRDGLATHHPRVEYRLEVRDGHVTAVTAELLETRDDVRTALAAQGSRVLPDDDRIVRKRLEANRRPPSDRRRRRFGW